MQYTAHSNNALLSRAVEFLLGRSPVLVLAATREAANDLARRAAGPAALGVFRHALRDLVLAMSNGPMLERRLSPVSRLAREAIAMEITARLRSRLTYLAPVAGFPGFGRALARTLEHLRLNRISGDQLSATGRSGPDLAALLKAYEQILTEGRYADHALRCILALEAVTRRDLLLLDLRTDSLLETELIAALKAAAPEYCELKLRPSPGPAVSRIDSLQRHVLTGEPVPALPPDTSVGVFSASGEALECAEIARRILRFAAAGTRFDQIGIFLRNPERHQPLVEEALSRAQIEGWFSQGTKRPEVAGRAFLALLHCAAEDLSAARFAEYLSLDQMPSAEEGQLRMSSRWERLLSRALVISGLPRWERRLEACAAELESPLEIGSLESLRGFALPVIRELASLPGQASWGEWLDVLRPLARRTLGKPDVVTEVLDELEPMRLAGPVTLQGVLATLAPELATRRKEESTPRYGKVFVGTPAEAAGMCFDVVFIPGMNEGIFPKPLREDPLLLDSQRNELGMEASRDDGQLLVTAVAAARNIVCSWSRIDLATGRERVPSFYAFEVAESAGWGEIDVQTFMEQARDGNEARLGWPAPADISDAIDSAEYDLAFLRPHWDDPQPGSAFWLKDANPHLWRALEARRLRWEPEWCSADGLIDTDVHVAVELERSHSLSVRSYSPTNLEQHARCPYRFYLDSVLNLRTADRSAALQHIPPRIRGELYHEVQFRLYTALQQENALPVQDLDAAKKRLDSILDEVEREFAERYAPSIPVVWKIDMERLRGDLRGWLRHVAIFERDWIPQQFEYPFKDTAVFGDLKLQGRIDLVERNVSGPLRVTDHKTGRRPEQKELEKKLESGELLQPALYAMAAEAKLAEPVRSARLFYATLRGNYTDCSIALTPDVKDAAENTLRRIEKSIRDAELPAAPRADGCLNCDYLPVCGPYEQQRVAIKKARTRA